MLAEIGPRIFVVGAPRSGTTLVQSLLASHGALTSFTESHLLGRHALPLVGGAALLRRDPTERLREFLGENDIDPPEAETWLSKVRWSHAVRKPVAVRARGVTAAFVHLLDLLARSRGASGWVEKTPRHLRFVGLLESVCGRSPGPHFVHVLRNGADVVSSLHLASRRWEEPYDLDRCVDRWNADVRASWRRRGSPGHHFVAYEALTVEPKRVLERLFSDLGLAWEPSVLEDYRRTAAGVVTTGEVWKDGVAGAIVPSRASRNDLTEEQRRWIERRLRTVPYDRLMARLTDGRPAADG
ncbi:MAG: sulfotransferase [Gemmatimonadetes bacterium]|nr:sulfotransferase [Gemmatimonadota bacterium]